MLASKAINFRNVFGWNNGKKEVKGITIPIVQRDYAQGREDDDVKRIRNRFLQVLFDALVKGQHITLDFIYGNIENDYLIPLDGQQRLTTLFLLHYYIARHECVTRDEWQFLHHFTYETRISSREFCKHLLEDFEPNFDQNTVSEQVKDDVWFPMEWENDPTIKAMLVMLDAIHDKFKTTKNLWPQLMGDAITFFFLPLDNLGMTDELYIKMNSRGKPLTTFENWKAELELAMKGVDFKDDPDLPKRIANKIDLQWTDMLWPYRNSGVQKEGLDDVIDDEFLRYVHFISDIIGFRPEKTETLVDVFEIIEKRFSNSCPQAHQAKENIKLMEKMFDVWVNEKDIKAFFESYISVSGNHEEGKIILNLPSKEWSINLFKECCKRYGIRQGNRSAFPLGLFIILYSFIRFGEEKDSIIDKDFRRRIRVVNNLVKNSSNEIRVDNMGDILSQIDSIILEGKLEKGVLNSKQTEEEIRKKDWTEVHPVMAETLFRLEDHKYLNGYVRAVTGEQIEHVDWCNRFESLFKCDLNLVNCALLAIEDCFEKDGDWRYQIGTSSPSKCDGVWRGLFSPIQLEDNMCDTLQKLLSLRESFDDVFLKVFVDDYLKHAKEFPLRWYIIQYEAMRTNRDGNYNNYGKYYWRYHHHWPKNDEGKDKHKEFRSKDYNVILMTTEWSMSGMNYDIFLKTLFELGGGANAGLDLGDYSYSRYNEGVDKLKMSNGNYLTLVNNVYEVRNANDELLDEYPIDQKEGIDIEDRVEVGLKLIKKWNKTL